MSIIGLWVRRRRAKDTGKLIFDCIGSLASFVSNRCISDVEQVTHDQRTELGYLDVRSDLFPLLVHHVALGSRDHLVENILHKHLASVF